MKDPFIDVMKCDDCNGYGYWYLKEEGRETVKAKCCKCSGTGECEA